MAPVLPALVQADADMLSSAMPPSKPNGWLTGIGLKKKTAKKVILTCLPVFLLWVCFLLFLLSSFILYRSSSTPSPSPRPGSSSGRVESAVTVSPSLPTRSQDLEKTISTAAVEEARTLAEQTSIDQVESV
jgi:hypothetical protein